MGSYIVGMVMTAIGVNLLIIVLVLASAALEAGLRSEAYARWSSRALHLLANVLISCTLGAMTVAFIDKADVEYGWIHKVLGFIGLMVAQNANIRAKFEELKQRPTPALHATFTDAVLLLPVGWVLYIAALFFAKVGPFEPLGDLMSGIALSLGGYLLAQIVAVGFFLLFGFSLFMTLLTAPLMIAVMRSERSRV